MNLTFWTSVTTCRTFDSHLPDLERPPPSIALNFLAATLSADLMFYSSAELRLVDDNVPVVGSGGFSTVQQGHYSRAQQNVAVKRSRLLSQDRIRTQVEPIAFEKHFAQLTLELRILTHARLAKHPNVLDLLGVCVDEYNEMPSFALVLEYSPLGTMRDFLSNKTLALSLPEVFNMIAEIANGLAAVHSLSIAHGDVKLDNVLIFPREADGEYGWRAKWADFGLSLIAPANNVKGKVEAKFGTPLLNAPELRSRWAFSNPLFNIESAMMTDVFSFGLLVWEALKDGSSFFDSVWIGPLDIDLDYSVKERFLNNLQLNQLLQHGLNFVGSLQLQPDKHSSIVLAMEACLQDIPGDRRPMVAVSELFERGYTGQGETQTVDLQVFIVKKLLEIFKILTYIFIRDREDAYASLITSGKDATLQEWSMESSLYWLIDTGLAHGHLIDDIPLTATRIAVRELESLANSKFISQDARAHAAMILSECHTLAIGSEQHDAGKVAHWLRVAATLGHPNAMSWYYRVCQATGIEPDTIERKDMTKYRQLEERLSLLPNEDYLMSRIHAFNASSQEQVLEVLSSTSGLPATFNLRIPLIFQRWEIETHVPLHFASWLGDNEAVSRLVSTTSPNVESAQGFNSAHFACLGGHASTLSILVDNGVNLSQQAMGMITPLHFAIFVPPKSVDQLIRLFVQANSDMQVVSGIRVDAHDLVAYGTPFEVAVTARHLPLVKALIPHCPNCISNGLGKAIDNSFWEIVEYLTPHCKRPTHKGGTHMIGLFEPRYQHWISHGPDHNTAIQRTIQLCKTKGTLSLDDNILAYFPAAMYQGNFHLVNAILSVASAVYVKQESATGASALTYSLEKSRRNFAWKDTISTLASFYSVEELHQMGFADMNFLSYAVFSDSLVGAEALIGRGVDVNHMPSDGEPPLAYWVWGQTSPEMFALLIQHGAKLNTDTFTFLLSEPWKKKGLDVFLQHALAGSSSDEAAMVYMRKAQGYAIFAPTESRESRLDILRVLLTYQVVLKHIDDSIDKGKTMLQRSAFHLDLPTMRLLLEAGADPSVSFVCDSDKIQAYALQICCTVGWILRDEVQWASRAMEVAMELLKSHNANRDDLFQGISALHIAHFSGNDQEVQRLSSLSCNDNEALGYWPGIEGTVTPTELAKKGNRTKLIQAVQCFVTDMPPKQQEFIKTHLERLSL